MNTTKHVKGTDMRNIIVNHMEFISIYLAQSFSVFSGLTNWRNIHHQILAV